MEGQPELSIKLAQLLVGKFGRDVPPLTDALYGVLSVQLEEVPPDRIDDFIDSIRQQYNLAKKLVATVGNIKPAHKRIALLHRICDDLIRETKKEEDQERPLSCKVGCSACCHLNVDITNDEARVLKHHWDGSNRDRLKKQAKVKDSLEFPHQLSWEDSACVFLKDNKCSIYEHRPMACRSYHVVSDPALCHQKNHPKHMVDQVIRIKVEFLKTVMYELQGCDNMARQLLK